jgi:hypothetical protein
MTSSGVDSRNYIRWDDPRVEKIPPGEAEDIQAVADMINDIQRAQFNMHRHCYGKPTHPIQLHPTFIN